MLPLVFPVTGAARVRDTWTATRPVYTRDASGRTVRTGAERPHHGIDIVVPRGTPIVSTTPGIITHVWSERQGRPQGNAVQIQDPDGLFHLYAHMQDVPDPRIVGWTVRAGQFIGRVGTSGSADGPHLHYQIAHSPGGRNDRVNPYRRLAELFAAAEADRTLTALRALPSSARGTQAAARVGDGAAAAALATDPPGPRPPVPPRGGGSAAAQRAEQGGSGVQPRPTQQNAQQRLQAAVTRDQADDAREAVRELLPSVERALERLEATGWQQRLARLVAPERAELARVQADRAIATARPFMATIRSNIDRAERFSDSWALWYPTWTMLSSIARMLISVGDPLRDAAAARSDSVVGPLLEQLADVRDLYEDVQQVMDMFDARVREVVDDVREIPGDLARGVADGFNAVLPTLPDVGNIFLGLGAIALLLLFKR